MKHICISFLVTILLVACSNTSKDDNVVPIDEIHRPSDYSNTVQFLLKKDFDNDGREYHSIESFKSEMGFDSFLDQIWKLAFSGDSKVHGVNFLGEFDEENELDPKELVEALTKFDTVWVEDLLTGEMKDSVLDVSFTQKDVSAISIYFACSNELTPYAIGLGKKVYDASGGYRGISHKFFLKLEGDMDNGICNQRLAIQSDSNGLMRPDFFDFYFDTDDTPFQNMLDNSADSTFKISLELILDTKGNSMRLSKLEGDAVES